MSHNLALGGGPYLFLSEAKNSDQPSSELSWHSGQRDQGPLAEPSSRASSRPPFFESVAANFNLGNEVSTKERDRNIAPPLTAECACTQLARQTSQPLARHFPDAIS